MRRPVSPLKNILIYNEMNTRTITLTLDKAKEWYKKGGELREIALQAFNIKELIEYPKTYEECISKLHINRGGKVEGYKCYLLDSFQKLLICRDVYWKILEKPWGPKWNDERQAKYIIHNYDGNIKKGSCFFTNSILAFPTPEMRDAFYENFKELIESCKELL